MRIRTFLVSSMALVSAVTLISGCATNPAQSAASTNAPATSSQASNSSSNHTVQSTSATKFYLNDAASFKQAWNAVAARVQPLAQLKNIKEESGGHFIAQVGTHVFVDGTLTDSGYTLDILPDRPMTNVKAATEMLLPYWRILIEATNPNLSTAQVNDVIRGLGLFNSDVSVPNREEYNWKRSSSGNVTYQLGFSEAPIVSALYGPDALSRKSYGTEVKFTMVLNSENQVVAVDTHRITEYEHHHPFPGTLTSKTLTQSSTDLFTELQSVVRFTIGVVPTPSQYPAGISPLVSQDAMAQIKDDLSKYYTSDLINKLITDEAYARMDEGVVQDGSLYVNDIQYGQGRLFLLPEPPFAEGQHYYVQNPMYSDASNYAWYDLATFANADPSVLNHVTVKGNKVTIVLNIKHQTSETTASKTMTYTFTLTGDGKSGLKIGNIDVPQYAGP